MSYQAGERDGLLPLGDHDGHGGALLYFCSGIRTLGDDVARSDRTAVILFNLHHKIPRFQRGFRIGLGGAHHVGHICLFDLFSLADKDGDDLGIFQFRSGLRVRPDHMAFFDIVAELFVGQHHQIDLQRSQQDHGVFFRLSLELGHLVRLRAQRNVEIDFRSGRHPFARSGILVVNHARFHIVLVVVGTFIADQMQIRVVLVSEAAELPAESVGVSSPD